MDNATAKLCILGCGSWGATMAGMLAAKGHRVGLWGHREDEVALLRERRHPPGVPELSLPPMEIGTDLAGLAEGADAAVLVVPAQAADAVCARLASLASPPPLAIIASKGIDVATLRPLSDVVAGRLPRATVAVVSGPCIAREVARGVPTSVVAACADEHQCHRIQHWFASPTFRVYRHSDVLGVEYGGALKNVIAIAAGACDGLGFGANSKSALVTRGLAEMRRVAAALGADDTTIMGLAGLGDLCVTCFSPHSRNRRFGEALGRGAAPAQAIAEIGEVVEGVPTADAVVRIAKQRSLAVPIAEAVAHMARGEWTPQETVGRLMGRELKDERG